jgi:signal transduction histidine kinase
MAKSRGKTVASKRGKVLRLQSATPKLVSNSQPPKSKERAELELDHLRESLVRQERMRAIGELASGVAHDLNNTLHAMSLRLSLIEQSPVCQAEQGENIGALSRIISDAALVVGRLQDFARQRQDRPLESVDVAAVVGEAIDIVRTGIEGQSSLDGAPIRIETELGSLPAVSGLASDLRHVIVNLLLNARDAMPRGGTIRVSGELAASRVVLKVTDEGRGIPPEHLSKIFDPFFTTKDVGEGTGLGLSIAYKIVQEHGGRIEVKSKVGQGTTFSVFLPVKAPQSQAMAA